MRYLLCGFPDILSLLVDIAQLAANLYRGKASGKASPCPIKLRINDILTRFVDIAPFTANAYICARPSEKSPARSN
jgi:hypothetical protein